MKLIDKFLNSVTMYRLTLYYVGGLVGIAVVLSFFHILAYNPLDIIISTGIAVIFCYISNVILSKIFRAPTNVESVFITACILALIIPIKFPVNSVFMAMASILAMISKYFVTIEKKHIFNPAAAAVLAISLVSSEHAATWWVGTAPMLPFVLIGGLLLIRKIRRETMVFTFLCVYVACVLFASIIHIGTLSGVLTSLQLSVFNSAMFFLGFVMLTEPLTSPATETMQAWYAAIVGILYAMPQLRIISFGITPEFALCVGNIFSYIVSPKYRLMLPLIEKKQVSPDSILFIFNKPKDFSFIPGQYMEWTLSHKNSDDRGNRRYFSLASSPTESQIMMLVKFYTPSSSYKKVLLAVHSAHQIVAGSLAGDFTLPKDTNIPLVFIAGGVGIAPFRSIVKYLIDTNQKRNIILLFTNRTKEDILFDDIWRQAESVGVKTIYTLTDTKSIPANWTGQRGYITEESIKREIPDYNTRTFYLSGPQLMVQRFQSILQNVGVSEKNIVMDFFPGYAES